MKTLFVHDHIFKRQAGYFFSSGGLPKSIWSRYTSVLDNITVVARDGGGLEYEEKGFTLSSADGVRFHLLPNISDFKSFLLGNKGVSQAARNLVGQHDAVIARLPSRLGSLFITEAIRQNKPYAIEVVGCPWDALWNYGGLKGKMFAPYAALELKKLVKSSRFTLYVTDRFLQSRYPAHKNAVTTSCSNVEISSVQKDVLTRRLENIANKVPGHTIVFGQIANYSSKYKGIEVAIKALKKANLPNWVFKVLGSGDPSFYKNIAEELDVADKVHFVGSLPSGGPVFDWLDSIDIYLHPSFQEGLPRALIEAMSRGVPALATKIAGIPELLNDSEMIVPGDHDALAEKILILSNDKNMQVTLAQKNFDTAKGYYKEILEARRMSFWQQFRKIIES